MSITNNLIPVPFANSASSTWKYSIPNTLSSTDAANKACWDVGFPAITMTDIAAGGIPFYGQDVNGVLNAITIAIRYIQAGNFQVYDSDFATSIGGYNKVSVIKGSDGNLYQSTIDGNTTNPVGGTNWKTFGSGNYLPLTGGTVTGTTNFTGTLQYKDVEVLKVGDYGVGGLGASISDFSAHLVGGFYGFNTSSLTNNPSPYPSSSAGITVMPTNSVNWKTEMLSVVGGSTPKIYYRTDTSSGKGSWFEAITTANIASYQSGLGVGQTYQDVTSSRTFGTTYTNSTGKPILVIVAMDNHDVNCTMTPTVGGVDLPSSTTGTSWNNRIPVSFVVPSGISYMVSTSTTRSLNKWVELR